MTSFQVWHCSSRASPLLVIQQFSRTDAGTNRPVTRRNIGEYHARLARIRTSEYAPQALAFRAGLEGALPGHAISLLTWREMEELVCGGGSDVWRLRWTSSAQD